MAPDACLMLYGDSLLLAGIGVQLRSHAGLEVITVEAGTKSLLDLVRAFKPAALLFDFALTPPDFAVPLLREYPDLLLIGVDPSRDEFFVLTSRAIAALSVGDLISVIRERAAVPGSELKKDLA